MLITNNIQITPEILALISKLDEFKGAWRSLGTLATGRLLALRRVATIESIGSSTRIEGSQLSDQAVEALLAKIEMKSFASRDEQEVAGYYIALRQTQGTIRTESPNWQPWITFFLSSLLSQVKRLEVKIEREHLLLATLPELSIQLLSIAREHGRLTVASAQAQTGANRHTIKLHIRKLMAGGHLAQQGTGRGTWYGIKG
jgi:Fic family protein